MILSFIAVGKRIKESFLKNSCWIGSKERKNFFFIKKFFFFFFSVCISMCFLRYFVQRYIIFFIWAFSNFFSLAPFPPPSHTSVTTNVETFLLHIFRNFFSFFDKMRKAIIREHLPWMIRVNFIKNSFLFSPDQWMNESLRYCRFCHFPHYSFYYYY